MSSLHSIRRILVPHRFGRGSETALAQGIGLAGMLGASITLLHAFDDPAEGGDDAADLVRELMPELAQRMVAEACRKLEKVAARVRLPGLTISTKARCGRPWIEISSEAAEGNFDLIVMGTHGRNRFVRTLLGSVTDKVAHTAPCPVLVVRGPHVPSAPDDRHPYSGAWCPD
jgi:nucleotide-binding universal stress UspA family protein